MKIQKKRSLNLLKWIGLIFLGLFLLLSLAALYLSQRWKPLLREKIIAGVQEASGGLYHIDFRDMHLNLLRGSVTFDSLQLRPDTGVYQLLQSRYRAPVHLFSLRMANLKISRIQLLKAYFHKELVLNTISLNRPSIDMIYHKVRQQPDTAKAGKTLYELISPTLKTIQAQHIRISDADFDYYVGAKKRQAIQHLDINFRDILIDSLSQYDSTRVLYAKDIGFELKGYRSTTKDNLYRLSVDTLNGSLNARTLRLRHLKLQPLYPDLSFSRKFATQKDRYDLHFPLIELQGIDFTRLSNEGTLYVRRLQLSDASVAVFLNRELPPPPINKGRNYPHNALKRLPFNAIVDTLGLERVGLRYTEYNEQTRQRGTLRLENLGGHILNVTNDSLRLSRDHEAHAQLHTAIMGAAKLNIAIHFNLTAASAPFQYSGTVQPFNMTVLNPLSKPLGQIALESGQVRRVQFDMQANEQGAKGKVQFTYSDLKVSLLKKDDAGKTTQKGLLSFLANTLLVKDQNPEPGKAPRTAHIQLDRVPQASFFNLMWKSIFLGIREIAGIGIVPMKNPLSPKK